MILHRINSLLTILCAVTALSSCTGTEKDCDRTKADNHDHGIGEIVITQEDALRYGIEILPAELQNFSDVIRVSGQIINSTTDEVTVTAKAAGIVTISPDVNTGSAVKAQSTIATVALGAVSGGNPNEAAHAAMSAAKKELDRLEPLLAEGIVTQREYNAALAAYQSAKAAYSPAASSGIVSSPISGVVTTLYVKSGMFVETGSPIATISKNSTLLLRAELPERYRNRIDMIKGANFRTSYSDDWTDIDSIGGKLSIVSPSGAEAQAGYIPVYFTMTNDGSLLAGAYAEVCLLLQPEEPSLSVPDEAITEQQGIYFVYVKTGDHTYEKRRIEKNESNGFATRIISGLNEGDDVVVKGVTMVRLAETNGAVPEGHSHNH